MSYRRTRAFCTIPVIFSLFYPVAKPAAAPDFSKEAFVLTNAETRVSFAASGLRTWQQTVSVRLQSEAAVRQYGVISFFYNSENERPEIMYVRVRKPDGSTMETPAASAVDMAAPVATVAPTYSDLRQKQIPVRSLGVGDVLEYSLRSQEIKAQVPGQFWYEQAFNDKAIVLNETLEIRVPREIFVQVSSPKLQSETHEEAGERVYRWKYSHLETSEPDNKKTQAADELPKVQISTFRNWEEIGAWWGKLAADEAAVTPAIAAKAKELTAGLSSDSEKARAIYKYVALKFRYISISFGQGRYRPHSADEVLANQYGDCKDKHTLFTALLKAAGIEAWPALIGAGIKFDPSVPSPSQFNHVITVLPQDGKYIWLDTTSEVAPFGLLNQQIRDEQALVIPPGGKALLLKTPADPPFRTSDAITVNAVLDKSGTLTGHLDFRLGGDVGYVIRTGLHQIAPAQWQNFLQQVSYAFSYSGDVSAVNIENLDEIDNPLRYSYDYTKKEYGNWSEHKILSALPPLSFGPGQDAEKPKEPFWAGTTGESLYRASIKLPPGFSIELPQNIFISSSFAEYSAHYSFQDGTFATERKMVIKQPKVALDPWDEYQKFIKAVRADETAFIALYENGSERAAVSRNNPEARELLQKATAALQAHDTNSARDLLDQAERLNPKQEGLWALRAYCEELTTGNRDQVIAYLRKEVQEHPQNTVVAAHLVQVLVYAGRLNEAAEVARTELSQNPSDERAALQVAGLLMRSRRYTEVPAVLEKAIAAAPTRYNLQVIRVEALLRDGKKEQGLAEAQKIAEATSDAVILNDLAYALSDTDGGIELAQKLARSVVEKTEQEAAKPALASFEQADLSRMNTLAAEWDTLGWACFKQNDLANAEKYVEAAWHLSQHAAVADHLGQIYDRLGRQKAAIRMWQLAVAADGSNTDAKDRLRKAGAPLAEPTPVTTRAWRPSPAEELVHLRTVKIPALPLQSSNAEFFLLVSALGIEDVQFINGSESLKDAAAAIQRVAYKFPFPDSGPEKLIRRGILSCSTYTTPSCQLTFLLPATARKN